MKIVMIGTFPPPIHGMSTINQAIFDHFIRDEWIVRKFNTSPTKTTPNMFSRFSRILTFIAIWIQLLKEIDSNNLVYLALSGGLGQIYDVITLLICRIKGAKCVLHHHSTAYLAKKKLIATILLKVAAKNTVQIALCSNMKEQLQKNYGCTRVVVLSNIVSLPGKEFPHHDRAKIKTIGFLSNITEEKGGGEFVKLAKEIKRKNWPIKCIIAGPCYDSTLTRALQVANKQGILDWVGPVYNDEKNLFWTSIDLFIFPTKYVNEAEPLVIWEALSDGIPVIAHDRGCISRQIGLAGVIIPSNKNFVSRTLEILNIWIDDPEIYNDYANKAKKIFEQSQKEAETQWDLLTKDWHDH